MALERELKFSSPDGLVPALEELNAALAQVGCSATDQGAALQVDLYYDDAAGSLEKAGLALRVREKGGRRCATLKSRGSALHGVHERDEFEEELAEGAPPPWPAGLEAKVPSVDLSALAPRMIISTERHAFQIHEGGAVQGGSLQGGTAQGGAGTGGAGTGAPVAELAFDAVVCRPSSEVVLDYSIDEARFDEVELEALSGAAGRGSPLGAADLSAIGAALQELLPLYPSDISKLERATALLAPFAG